MSFLLLSGLLTVYSMVAMAAVRVSIDSRSQKNQYVRHFSFCNGCSSPNDEGSIALALFPTHGNYSYRITEELIYGVPNHGEKEVMVNGAQLKGRAVLLDRGKIEVVHKALRVQNAGAIALIVADDGSCSSGFASCGARAGNSVDGFAPYDSKDLWSRVYIPVLVVSLETAERLRGMMNIQVIEMPFLGPQNVSRAPAQLHRGEEL